MIHEIDLRDFPICGFLRATQERLGVSGTRKGNGYGQTRSDEQQGLLSIGELIMSNGRRLFLKTVGGWAVGGVVGQIAYDLSKRAAGETGRSLDDLAQEVIRSYVGRIIMLPVWTGSAMMMVECDFSETETGFHLFGRRVVRRLSDGAACAEAGRELVEMGLVMSQAANLEITTDFNQVEGLDEEG